MLDFQRIVDDLRGSLYSGATAESEFLRAALADFELAVDQVNGRLRQCGALLRQGLRSEAIQLCEIEPNLLDAVATLDLPERDQLDQFLRASGMPKPAALLVEVAGELNEAYAVEQPLATLLTRHRLLALARSPLPLRIGALRELMATDPGNPVWQEDLQTFERERHKQIQAEAAEAGKARDVQRLTQLRDELVHEPWTELPPTALVNLTTQSCHKLTELHARLEIERLEARLTEAFSAFDSRAARLLRESWNKYWPVSGLTTDDAVYERALPALEWLEQEDNASAREAEFHAVLRSLEHALDRDTAWAPLERLYAAATRHGQELPKPLEHRYRTRVKDLKLSSARRTRLILACVGLSVVLVAGAIGAGVFYQLRRSEIASRVTTLAKLIEDAKLPEAQDYLDDLRQQAPSVAAAPEIGELAATLSGLVKSEEERAAAFEQYFEKASAAGPEQPDHLALQEASKLAKTEAEKANVFRFEREVAAARAAKRRIANAALLEELDTIAAQITTLENAAPREAAESQTKLSELTAELRGLRRKYPVADPSVHGQAKVLEAKLTAISKRMVEHQSEQAQLAAITASVGNLPRYETAVQQYIKAYPGSARSADFAQAMAERDVWQGIEALNDFASQLEPVGALVDPKAARTRLEAVNALLSKYSKYPQTAALRERLPYWQAVAGRLDRDGQPIERRLHKLFGDALVKDLWMVQRGDQRYYFRGQVALPERGSQGFKHLVAFDLSERTVTLSHDTQAVAGPAPQAEVAEKSLSLLKQLGPKDWEKSFFRILQTIHANERIDPLLKLNLLDQTAEVASTGSHTFRLAFAEYLEQTKSNVNPFAEWLDPDDVKVKTERGLASKALSKLPSLETVGKKLAAQLKSPSVSEMPVFRPYGWLARVDSEKWQCLGPAPVAEADLYVLLKTQGNAAMSWQRVGQVGARGAVIDAGPGALREGRWVFVRQANQD